MKSTCLRLWMCVSRSHVMPLLHKLQSQAEIVKKSCLQGILFKHNRILQNSVNVTIKRGTIELKGPYRSTIAVHEIIAFTNNSKISHEKWSILFVHDKCCLISPWKHVSLKEGLQIYMPPGALFPEGRGDCAHLNHFIVVWAQTHLQWEQNWMEIGITLVFRRAREAVPPAGWQFVTSASSWTINLITMVHCTAGPWDSSTNSI